MVEVQIDNKTVEVNEGSMIMHAAEAAGTYVPHFCYHKKLSIAANCRMCLVDVDKAAKPLPACATPVTQGMIVRTQSKKALQAQKSVMEFLLINHPLDCPICDQGGECQLQDLAVGYGGSASRYQEEKRVVFHKEAGPLISMQEMSRCIQCTRCVRFGEEVAGLKELGFTHRGEHAEIESFVGLSVDSELSGNMIDICPVGALTSKPFRFQARTWELGRRKSVSPHDSTGTNLIMQVKNHKVLRVVPLENEAINECWIADRDRFSYEALSASDRLTTPMIKQAGVWHEVDWNTALNFVADALKDIAKQSSAKSIGALMSPHNTTEELFLGARLLRAMGSDNVDARLRHADFRHAERVNWLGSTIEELSHMDNVFVVGGNVRKHHPILAQRLRSAIRHGAQVLSLNDKESDWAMPVSFDWVQDSEDWVECLANLCATLAHECSKPTPFGQGEVTQALRPMAQALLSGERKTIVLGNAAAHHPQFLDLLSWVNALAQLTGAKWGVLGESANTVGAQWVGARPSPARGGLHVQQMLEPGALKAIILMNLEPEHDCAQASRAVQALGAMDLVVTLSPFKTNMAYSDVLLPMAPFTETAGSFVNTEGESQSFHAVVRPLEETRPLWKILRVMANLLELPGFDFETIDEVRSLMTQSLPELKGQLSNLSETVPSRERLSVFEPPCVAASLALDGLVRRSSALQSTHDARVGV
jgi:NADH-quinone oxidoreductase subunit G